MTGIERARPYEYEINMSKEDYVDEDNYDEWGAAFLWWKPDSNIGVEYNICMDCGHNCSAIYLTIFNTTSEYLETDYNTFEHYEIDWNDLDWEEKLVRAMWKTFNSFKAKGYYDVRR